MICTSMETLITCNEGKVSEKTILLVQTLQHKKATNMIFFLILSHSLQSIQTETNGWHLPQ